MSESAFRGGDFIADPEKCIGCGKCAKDCPTAIITIEGDLAKVPPEDMADCLGCQHCLAICPTAAASVAGRNPVDSVPVGGCDPTSLDLLVRSRRSIRQFAPGSVEQKLLDRVLAGAAHAPTGVNARYRRFTVIRDPRTMSEYRDRCCRALTANADKLPEDLQWLASAAGKWLDKGRDVIFRNAPHLIVVTSGPWASTPDADAVIALSYFELLAQANGIATVWCGMAEMMLKALPETGKWLGIPEDHSIGYAMLFGPAGIKYERTAQYAPENMAYVDRLAE